LLEKYDSYNGVHFQPDPILYRSLSSVRSFVTGVPQDDLIVMYYIGIKKNKVAEGRKVLKK
jgi:hypothetical protein